MTSISSGLGFQNPSDSSPLRFNTTDAVIEHMATLQHEKGATPVIFQLVKEPLASEQQAYLLSVNPTPIGRSFHSISWNDPTSPNTCHSIALSVDLASIVIFEQIFKDSSYKTNPRNPIQSGSDCDSQHSLTSSGSESASTDSRSASPVVSSLERVEESMRKLTENNTLIEKQIQVLESSRNTQKRYTNENQGLFDSKENTLKELNQRFHALQHPDPTLSEEAKAVAIRRISDEMRSLITQLKELKTTIKSLNLQILGTSEKIDRLTTQIAENKAEIAKLNQECLDLTKQARDEATRITRANLERSIEPEVLALAASLASFVHVPAEKDCDSLDGFVLVGEE